MEKFIKKIENYNKEYMAKLPPVIDIESFIDGLIDFMFPMRLCSQNAKLSSREDLSVLESKFSI